MSNKVVPINRGMFLGAYNYAHNVKHNSVEAIIMIGVIFSIGLPQIILSIYGGIIPFIAFAGITSVGSLIGLVIYRHSPYRLISLVDAGLVTQWPPCKAHKRKHEDAA